MRQEMKTGITKGVCLRVFLEYSAGPLPRRQIFALAYKENILFLFCQIRRYSDLFTKGLSGGCLAMI